MHDRQRVDIKGRLPYCTGNKVQPASTFVQFAHLNVRPPATTAGLLEKRVSCLSTSISDSASSLLPLSNQSSYFTRLAFYRCREVPVSQCPNNEKAWFRLHQFACDG